MSTMKQAWKALYSGLRLNIRRAKQMQKSTREDAQRVIETALAEAISAGLVSPGPISVSVSRKPGSDPKARELDVAFGMSWADAVAMGMINPEPPKGYTLSFTIPIGDEVEK